MRFESGDQTSFAPAAAIVSKSARSSAVPWRITVARVSNPAARIASIELPRKRTLADMVTRNPAQAVGWSEVGSVEAGKHADLLVLSGPKRASPYAALVDATQRDVRLVLVDGSPVAGDPDALRAIGARFQRVGGKGVVLRESVAKVERTLRSALRGLGSTTWLRTHWNGGRDRTLTDAEFRGRVLTPLFGSVKLESIDLTPLFTANEHWLFSFLAGTRDAHPPYRPYRANRNWIRGGNPFAGVYRRWYARRPK